LAEDFLKDGRQLLHLGARDFREVVHNHHVTESALALDLLHVHVLVVAVHVWIDESEDDGRVR
jgi:hypothetical protein